MYITKIYANFGKLLKKDFELKNGLNIIYGENEAGKSTIAAFLKAMFYGISSNERDKEGYIAEKNKYAPIDGTSPEGSIIINLEGSELKIERTTKRQAAPLSELKVTDLKTGIEQREFNDTNIGERLFLLSKESYEKVYAAFQGSVIFANSYELEAKIKAIATTADEDISFSEVIRRLEKFKKERLNKGGVISKLKDEIKELKNTLLEINQTESEIKTIESIITELQKAKKRCETDIAIQKSQQAKELVLSIEQLKTQAQQSLKEAEQYKSWQQNEKMQELTKEYYSLSEAKPKSIYKILSIIFFASLLLFPLGILFFILYKASKKQAEAQKIQATELQKSINELKLKEELFSQKIKEAEILTARYEQAIKSYDIEALKKQAEMQSEDEPYTNLNEKELLSKMSETDKQIEINKERLIKSKTRLEAIMQKHEIEEKLEVLSKGLKDSEEELLAIEIAREVMYEAEEEIQKSLTPLLTKRTAEIFKSITNGSYSNISIKENKLAGVEAENSHIEIEQLYLSEGTRQQLYFSYRLALSELLSASNMPLLFDDSFVSFDNKRLQSTLDFLKTISDKRQIIILTCHEREKALLKYKSGVNIINI